MNKIVLLVGTGPMAVDYVKVLHAQNIKFNVVGRGEESAKRFKLNTGITPFVGGLKKYLKKTNLLSNTDVIIATGTEALMSSLLLVLEAGASRVLIEKPAAISIEELLENEEKLKIYTNNIFVAYNRRFYASVIEAQKMIEEDGGLLSMHFEFTEWANKIEPLTKAQGVKENWFFANSTHVIDLAFYLAGVPNDWKTFSKPGKLKWHKKTNFVGAGETEKGVLFSYMSNWESAGRWGIELLTEKRRIYLKPLESIYIQFRGTVELVEHKFDDSLDLNFKAGLYLQICNFMVTNQKHLLSLNNHIANTKANFIKILQ